MRRTQVLPLFGLCAAALVGVMAWLTATVRRLDEAERRGREQAALEESVRLSLWRMESLLAPLIAQENTRSPTAYARAAPPGPGAPASPHVRLHFQWNERGQWSAVAVPRKGAAPSLERTAMQLAERSALLARLPAEWLQTESRGLDEASGLRAARPVAVAAASKAPATAFEQQQFLNAKEYQARSSNVAKLQQAEVLPSAPQPATVVRIGRLQPLWVGDELLLARRVGIGQQELVQACWLDWPALRASLLEAIADLQPAARLEPAEGLADEARRLAALPVKLVPGAALVEPVAASAGLLTPLSAAWALSALALFASGALLWGLTTLGERRAAFVSAVTHELRTPLTTFRMYADMLAEGMVPKEREREYLDTLRREAERQAHLVENVLAYSRLERGRYRAARETVTLSELLAGLLDGLKSQVERAGMTWVAPELGGAGSVAVLVDRSGVERILTNLVDNACKYARQAADRRIQLECRALEKSVELCVSDHGPGVSAREARRLFRPFHKSAQEAAHSAPGVGLGLALSARLARALGGSLSLSATDGAGARFCLRLPRA